jgi:hypothetical protein
MGRSFPCRELTPGNERVVDDGTVGGFCIAVGFCMGHSYHLAQSKAIESSPQFFTNNAMISSFPTGTVTFLFTDVEGSTALGERQCNGMLAALAKIEIFNRLSYCSTSEVIQCKSK